MIKMTRHAKERQIKYGLAQDWIDAAIMTPDRTVDDPDQAGVTRSFKTIAERGGKVLRVAYRPEGDDVLVLSVFFDRGAKP